MRLGGCANLTFVVGILCLAVLLVRSPGCAVIAFACWLASIVASIGWRATLAWLFPIIDGAFFGGKTWPSLCVGCKAIVSEVIHAIAALGIMMGFTLIEGPLYLYCTRETVIERLPHRDSKRRGEHFEMKKLRAEDLTPAILQRYIAQSEPVIIKGLSEEMFVDLIQNFSPPSDTSVNTGAKKNQILINQYTLPGRDKLGNDLYDWIKKFIGRPIIYILRFSGNYSSGFAHIDTAATYNFYYVKRGKKKGFIVPRQYNDMLHLQPGYDSIFVPDSAGTAPDAFKFLETVPGAFKFDLVPGDVMLFNNSACVHKFMNASEHPEVLSIRMVNMDISPLTAANDCFHWTQARYIAKVVLSGGIISRPALSVEKI